MIGVVNYGSGNFNSIIYAYKSLGIDSKIVYEPSELIACSHLILPGVGHFDKSMRLLNASGLRPSLEASVVDYQTPVLGICVGMQMMAYGSDEGFETGLGWIPGRVRGLSNPSSVFSLPVPHIGWNNVSWRDASSKLRCNSESDSERYYFLHSYRYECEREEFVSATTEYGVEFTSIISHNNIYGVQFHPEKSHDHGMIMLENFSKI